MKSAQLLVRLWFDSGSLFDGSKKRRFSKTESVKKWAAITLKTHGGANCSDLRCWKCPQPARAGPNENGRKANPPKTKDLGRGENNDEAV